MKHVDACESNSFESAEKNIRSVQNIIETKIDRGLEKVIALSTDKACGQ